MEEGGADRYICLGAFLSSHRAPFFELTFLCRAEPGQVGSFVELKAGESWEGGLTLAFSD